MYRNVLIPTIHSLCGSCDESSFIALHNFLLAQGVGNFRGYWRHWRESTNKWLFLSSRYYTHIYIYYVQTCVYIYIHVYIYVCICMSYHEIPLFRMLLCNYGYSLLLLVLWIFVSVDSNKISWSRPMAPMSSHGRPFNDAWYVIQS